MADEEKQATLMEMRQRWSENQGKIRNVRGRLLQLLLSRALTGWYCPWSAAKNPGPSFFMLLTKK
jgi:hypothetical protein